MRYVEFGHGHGKVMILLHGGGLSWWNYREVAKFLQQRYRVILPILDGHAGSDASFTSIEDNAQRIVQFIREELGGSVLLLGGVSLGGQILLRMLAQAPDICRYAIVESAQVIPSPVTRALVSPAMACSYGLIQKPWFAKLQFRYLGLDTAYYPDYYRDTCAISKQSMTAFLQANGDYTWEPETEKTSAEVWVLAGQKEPGAVLRSARRIHDNLPGSYLRLLPKLRHGQFALNHPQAYVALLEEITQGKVR